MLVFTTTRTHQHICQMNAKVLETTQGPFQVQWSAQFAALVVLVVSFTCSAARVNLPNHNSLRLWHQKNQRSLSLNSKPLLRLQLFSNNNPKWWCNLRLWWCSNQWWCNNQEWCRWLNLEWCRWPYLEWCRWPNLEWCRWLSLEWFTKTLTWWQCRGNQWWCNNLELSCNNLNERDNYYWYHLILISKKHFYLNYKKLQKMVYFIHLQIIKN